MLIDVGILFSGMVLLYVGSEFLVRGAASTALLLSIRPVVVGLTVVAFATSAPELLVSLVASVRGSGGISVGNILGSNVINIALVLGISAMIKPITINRQIVRFDLPYMLGASFVFWILCLDGYIGYGDGGDSADSAGRLSLYWYQKFKGEKWPASCQSIFAKGHYHQLPDHGSRLCGACQGC